MRYGYDRMYRTRTRTTDTATNIDSVSFGNCNRWRAVIHYRVRRVLDSDRMNTMSTRDAQTPLFFEIHVFIIVHQNDRLRILDVIDHVHDRYPDTGESGSAYDSEIDAKLV